jgi:hypothetical protein
MPEWHQRDRIKPQIGEQSLQEVRHVFNVPEFPRMQQDGILFHGFFNGLLAVQLERGWL